MAGQTHVQNRRQIALVADDHELYRTGLSSLLRHSLGFEQVIEVTTFQDALARLGSNPLISLATLDLAMTGVNGAASLQLIRHLRPTLPVAVITGSTRREDLLQALAAGVQGYAPKTLCATELARGLETVLDGRLFVPPALFDPTATWPEPADEPDEGGAVAGRADAAAAAGRSADRTRQVQQGDRPRAAPRRGDDQGARQRALPHPERPQSRERRGGDHPAQLAASLVRRSERGARPGRTV